MAITTLDGAIAGMMAPVPIVKAGVSMSGVGSTKGYTPWYVGGSPGAATANSAGIDGAAVSAPHAGQFPRTNPGSGNAYLARLAMQTSVAGSIWLIDRLWHNSGLSVTSTSSQAISPATLPARDAAGSTNGANVLAAVEWSAAGGAGVPTVTLTYTDQDGNAGASATVTGSTTPALGLFEIFQLGAGDTGIRAPTSFIQSATRTSGTMHLVLFRPIAQIEVTTGNTGNAIDALTSGMPRIYNDSVLQLLFFPSLTTATTFIGQYIETQG